MREIKFRAWDGEGMFSQEDQCEEYYFEVSPTGLKLFLIEQSFECGSGVAEERWSDVETPAEFLQFTGLKDKNGVEIYYNSSIFKFKWMTGINEHEELIGVMDFNEDDLRAEIDIYNNKSYVCLSYINNGLMFDFEVIGTMQENPELLEQAK